MNKTTDKYYDEKFREATFHASTEVMKALNFTGETTDLCMEDINALARFLVYQRETKDNIGFSTVVDYLWMSYRITLNTKMCLLDLLEKEVA